MFLLCQEPGFNAVVLFHFLDGTDWEEAGLGEVINYLLQSRHVKIPEEWQSCFDTPIGANS